MSSIPKGYLEEIFGIDLRARHRENGQMKDPFRNPIIHKQIHGDKEYVPLNRKLWNL